MFISKRTGLVLILVSAFTVTACGSSSSSGTSDDGTAGGVAIPGRLAGIEQIDYQPQDSVIPVTLVINGEAEYGSSGEVKLGELSCMEIIPPEGYVMDNIEFHLDISVKTEYDFLSDCSPTATVHTTLPGMTVPKVGGRAQLKMVQARTVTGVTVRFVRPSDGHELEVNDGKFYPDQGS